MRRSAVDRPHVLSNVWQPVLEEIYARRSRPRASYADYAEAVLRFLDASGQLGRFARPGVEPLDAIKAFNDSGPRP